MSRNPHHLFDRDPSLSSIHDSNDSFEAEVCACHHQSRRQRAPDPFDLRGFISPRSSSPHCSCVAPHELSRGKRQDREIANLKYEVEALKHMFIERSGSMVKMELSLERAVRQLSAEAEKLEERRKQLSFAEARLSEKAHVPHQVETAACGHSTCVFPNPVRSVSKSPGDFSFSNKETDETTMFSFGEIDENIEVYRAYTAKYPHDSLELEEPEPKQLEHHEVILLPFIYEPRRTGCELSKSYPILLGESVAERYRIDAIIASTNFSTVLMCYDSELRKDVCVKVLHNQKEVLDQGLDEIKVWKLLESKCGDLLVDKHLARLLDFFYYKEHLFIVSELLGENLYLIYSSPETKPLLTLETIQRITVQILIALDCLHTLGVIHADVKPENVLLSKSVRKLGKRPKTVDVTLADFGSSCFLTDELTTYIQSQAYRAPEVIVGGVYSTKIDIWSLGCVLAELLTGEVLLAASSPEESLYKVNTYLDPASARQSAYLRTSFVHIRL